MNRKKWAAAMLVLPALHRALHALILLVCTGAAGMLDTPAPPARLVYARSQRAFCTHGIINIAERKDMLHIRTGTSKRHAYRAIVLRLTYMTFLYTEACKHIHQNNRIVKIVV